MPTPRRRRIVRHAVMALAVVALLGVVWLVIREPPEIERSRGIKLGMTLLEVEAVMQPTEAIGLTLPNGRELRMFGAVAQSRKSLKAKFNEYLGKQVFKSTIADYPVRVRFDKNCRADRIDRGDETEEAPQQ